MSQSDCVCKNCDASKYDVINELYNSDSDSDCNNSTNSDTNNNKEWICDSCIDLMYETQECKYCGYVNGKNVINCDCCNAIGYAKPNNKQKYLQKQFLKIIKKMNDTDCDIPDNFELFYCIKKHHDRSGTAIHIKPYLTKQKAKQNCGENSQWSGKYGSDIDWIVADKNTKVSTENYYSDHETSYETSVEI